VSDALLQMRKRLQTGLAETPNDTDAAVLLGGVVARVSVAINAGVPVLVVAAILDECAKELRQTRIQQYADATKDR